MGRPRLIGIGASAGGLESLELLFGAIPRHSGNAFVVVQHLSADHRSMMPELLSRVSPMPVGVASHGQPIQPDTVTLIPPGQFITVRNGHFLLEAKPPPPTLTLPVDRFFESMAEEWGEDAVGVILSGTGTDGTRGAERLRSAGAFVVAEDPASARFDGMPRSVIDAGVVDLVAGAEEIGHFLARLAAVETRRAERPPSPDEDALARIVRLLHKDTAIDFENYKRATIGRRVARRMHAHDLDDAEDYLTLLGASEEERALLFRELLIRVTSFFRDPDVWTALAERVLAPLVADPDRHDVLRLWVPACSTGEEAYTVAMLALDEVTRAGRDLDVKVFATDVDRDALEVAARGRYREGQVGGIDPARLERYFTYADGAYTVASSLRRCVMFAPHNVTNDAPFTRLDVISCRNLFIYLNAELQARVLRGFHFALRPGGTLVLGTSEGLGDQEELFSPIDAARKVFQAQGERRGFDWVADSASLRELRSIRRAQPLETAAPAATPVGRALERLAEWYLPPSVLVDHAGNVRHVFGDVSAHLRLAAGMASVRVLDLARPELRTALAAGLPRALRTGEPTSFPALVPGPEGEDPAPVTVRVLPVGDVPDRRSAMVVFEPAAGALVELPLPADTVAVQLDELQRELQRARIEQQLLVEQLEGSNEELQATNEEMVAANEELQATNEELQSVNEELFTVNAENARRIQELEVLRSDLDHLLAATDVGALVVDNQLVIRRFTASVGEFLPILERDIGRPLAHLANSLGGAEFLAEVADVIETGEDRERSIDSVHGPVLVRMIPYRMREMPGALITFVDVSTVKRNFEFSRRVLDVLPAHVAFIDQHGTITMVNAAWERFARENGGTIERLGPGTNYFTACKHDPDAVKVAEGMQAVLAGDSPAFSHVYPCNSPDGTERWFLLQVTSAGNDGAVVVHFDITSQKQAERMLLGLATHDPLTGVLNRRGIEAELDIVLRRGRRIGRSACALMLDCDDFKKVNDRVGHAGGDAVLRTVARRIGATLRAGDLLARIGGDEFLVLLPEATPDAAHVAAERVRLAVASEPVAVSHEDISLTVSVAMVPLDENVHTLEHLLDRSRDALRTSKKRGKNRVTDGLRRTVSRQREELTRLLDRHQFGAAAQPIVTTHGGEVVGVELLARQLAPPFSPPTTVFRIAMEEGMLAIVDEHLLGVCLDAARRLDAPGSRHVNLYPSTLLTMSPDRIDSLFGGWPRRHPVVVELSEQQLVGDPIELLPNLDRLRSHGVQISLDDVGFGRTSLETLIIVEPNIVKIDASCIQGVHVDESRRRWLARLVQAARSLGATIVAEGVEQRAEVDVVEHLAIEWCQGFYFAEPNLVA